MHTLALDEAVSEIADGDLLLYRRRGLIAVAGRSRYSHAAMAVWMGGRPFVAEMVLGGGRARPLRGEVRRRPGRWDWFSFSRRARHSVQRALAAQKMLELIERPYNLRGLLLAACLHLPLARLLVHPDFEDAGPDRGRPLFCSQAFSAAWRLGAGVDLVPELADRITEPGDLARCALFAYRGTLQ